MTPEVYRRLAQYLDDLPGGFPATESGVELRLLQHLFTPEEAELTLHLTLIPEEAPVIALRAQLPAEEVAERLAEMERKGLIFSLHRPGKPPQYAGSQFVVGIYEYQVGKLDADLVRDFEEYLPVLNQPEVWKKGPQLRTVPVGESLDVQLDVLPYERAEALIGNHTRFSVAPCICRQEQAILGHECSKPRETCLSFGIAADYYTRNGLGRSISREEVLGILKQAEEAGLVLQPGNAREALFMCTCCGCCCGVLRSLKRHPKPASVVSTPFYAAVDPGLCDGCGTCTDRCQMEAIGPGDDLLATVNLDRCIGCGLCVTKCPTGAVHLVRKPDAEQSYVPKDIVEASIRLAQSRGKMSMRELIGMQVRSKVDRLRSG